MAWSRHRYVYDEIRARVADGEAESDVITALDERLVALSRAPEAGKLDPMAGHMDQLKTGLHAFLTSYTDKYGVFPSHPTHKHSQSARDGRTPAPQRSHFYCGRGTRRHYRSRP